MPETSVATTTNKTAALSTRNAAIAEETSLLNTAASLVNEAVSLARSGTPARDCGPFLAGARILHGISRQSITNRMSAGRLAMQEAKLIEQETTAAA